MLRYFYHIFTSTIAFLPCFKQNKSTLLGGIWGLKCSIDPQLNRMLNRMIVEQNESWTEWLLRYFYHIFTLTIAFLPCFKQNKSTLLGGIWGLKCSIDPQLNRMLNRMIVEQNESWTEWLLRYFYFIFTLTIAFLLCF